MLPCGLATKPRFSKPRSMRGRSVPFQRQCFTCGPNTTLLIPQPPRVGGLTPYFLRYGRLDLTFEGFLFPVSPPGLTFRGPNEPRAAARAHAEDGAGLRVPRAPEGQRGGEGPQGKEALPRGAADAHEHLPAARPKNNSTKDRSAGGGVFFWRWCPFFGVINMEKSGSEHNSRG